MNDSSGVRLTIRVGSVASTPAASTDVNSSPAPSDDGSLDKPARKRAPRRAPGTEGLGKAWRKGLKGDIAGTAGAPRDTSHRSPSASTSTLPTRATPTPIRALPKIATKFLPPLVLPLRTPKPRVWQRTTLRLTSITGKTIVLPCWQGAEQSAYASQQLSLVTEDYTHAALPPLGVPVDTPSKVEPSNLALALPPPSDTTPGITVPVLAPLASTDSLKLDAVSAAVEDLAGIPV